MAKKLHRTALLVALAVCALCLAGCWLWPPSPTFELTVTPAAIADLAQNAIGMFLVSIDDLDGSLPLPAALRVVASDGLAIASSTTVREGEVVEVRLYGEGVAVDTTIQLTIEARRGDETHSAEIEATITEPVSMPDDRLETGLEMRALFLPWLIAEHPELGITADTAWTPNPVRPHILEVSFCMFLSAEWELVVWWHVMIPPYDWTRMYLRHRSTELAASFGAQISSRAAGDAPVMMVPPEEVWR